jgi:peptidoglycan/LPS O-acetylase OafA/YrhL
MTHIRSLDGLRGIAIIAVMLFHLKVPGFSLGWAGVPLFFVLSGFLITRILIEDKDRAFSAYIRAFYVRRTLRIFPLFYAYLLLNWIALNISGRSDDGYLWYLGYVQNYHIANELNRGGDLPGVVGHTWSLAVEEQFYLVWPFLVYLLNRKILMWVCAGLVIVAPLTRLYLVSVEGNVFLANTSLVSCLDMMGVGALLACIVKTCSATALAAAGRIFNAAAVVGLVSVLFVVNEIGLNGFWSPRDWAKPGFYLYTAFACLFGWLVYHSAIRPIKSLDEVLSIGPLVFTGKISYGLYVWHPVVFLAVEKRMTTLSARSVPIVSVAV